MLGCGFPAGGGGGDPGLPGGGGGGWGAGARSLTPRVAVAALAPPLSLGGRLCFGRRWCRSDVAGRGLWWGLRGWRWVWVVRRGQLR